MAFMETERAVSELEHHPSIYNMSQLNSIASTEQIRSTPSRVDGISAELEEDLRNFGCELIQSAGILLKLPQVAMATAQVLLQRFFYMASLKEFGVVEIGMGALFLASKLEESFAKLTNITMVYDHLLRRCQEKPTYPPLDGFSQRAYDLKNMLITGEMQILKKLGFHVHVQLPYGLTVNYLRILDLEEDEKVAGRAWNYLNDGLRSIVYAVYQPNVVACAAIWLACRDTGVKLPANWYKLFDASTEDFESAAGHIKRLYYRKLKRRELPLDAQEMQRWLAK